jgi:hypothetical protein
MKTKEEKAKYDKLYREKNKEKIKKQKREYKRQWITRPGNREKHNEVCRRSISKHRERNKQKSKKYYWDHKNDKVLAQKIKKFGITVEQFNEMFKKQEGVCKICGSPQQQNKRLCIDHNHNTEEVRGLLCFQCNRSLGWYEKYSDKIQNYLK